MNRMASVTLVSPRHMEARSSKEVGMPRFEIIPSGDVPQPKPTGRRAEILNEYKGYIEQVGRKGAGKLTPGEGETTQAVRRRLGAAAKLAGTNLVVKRNGHDIYFWTKARRGRPPKAA